MPRSTSSLVRSRASLSAHEQPGSHSINHSNTSSNTSKTRHNNPRTAGDASIRRGAALIRKEITRQFSLQKEQQQTPAALVSTISSGSDEHTDFSDVWLNTNPYGQNNKKSVLTPPRMAQKRTPNTGHSGHDSLEYSLEESMGTTPEDVRTFASRGDASQWAKGSVLISPPSSPLTPPTRQKQREQQLWMNHENYDFISDDYVEEFELDDYDEVCHPLYSRRDHHNVVSKPNLRRLQTPPISQPPSALLNAPQKKAVTPQKSEILRISPLNKEKPKVPSPALFEERRQGPPSPATSCSDSMTSSSQQHYNQHQPKNCEVPSPMQIDYDMLLQDPAYRHAQHAGHLWQSLVGHHIRFPSRWWNGARAPPLGLDAKATGEDIPWQYLGRFACRDKRLHRFVKNRAAPGRLLLHIVMLDLVTCKPLQDICVGCFHPSARGIRRTVDRDPSWDGVRDLWLAVRKRTAKGGGDVSVMDKHLNVSQEPPTKSPLGPKQKVTNQNVRAVFGEEPPVETMFVPESYLYEVYMAALKKHNHAVAPPLVLLQEFVLG